MQPADKFFRGIGNYLAIQLINALFTEGWKICQEVLNTA
jgi:hypothetical protein